MSNCSRFAAVPLTLPGTTTSQWLPHCDFPEFDLADCPGLVLVAAHPDDETLGLGGTAALLAGRGVQVRTVVVSDGGNAHPGRSPIDRAQLEGCRRAEVARAAGVLGIGSPIHLGLPDGRIADYEADLTRLLIEQLEMVPGAWCATTWRGDGHPDHESVGRAAARAGQRCGRVLLEYPVWMWHWAVPGDRAVPWHRAYTVPVSPAARSRKQLAIQSFTSQLNPPEVGGAPILPAFVLRRLLAVGEVIFR